MARPDVLLWRACESIGLSSAIRRGVLAGRNIALGRHLESSIGGVDATFEVSTWPEYRRLRSLHGEGRILSALLSELDGSEVIWDVGANVGLYAAFLARSTTTGAVVGIEPEPRNALRLLENLALNAPPNRWLTVPLALTDWNGLGWLDSTHSRTERTTIGNGHHFLADEGWLQVACRRGDHLLDGGVPAPDVLKIDVQGAEYDVLQGLGESLSEVNLVYLEVHTEKSGRYGATPADVHMLLDDFGFELENLGLPDGNRSGVYFLKASR